MSDNSNVMKRLIFTLGIISLMIFSGCGNREARKEPRPFPYPEVPAMMAPGAESAKYINSHFWNRFLDTATYRGKSDTAMVAGVTMDEFRNAFMKFIYGIASSEPENMDRHIGKMLDKAFAYVRATADTSLLAAYQIALEAVFYNPNSPLRNDETIVSAYGKMEESGLMDEMTASKCRYILGRASLNRPGNKACDFMYTTLDGEENNLHSTQADWLILFFNNPDCPACASIIDYAMNSDIISEKTGKGQVKILTVYIDHDIESWASYSLKLPDNWIKSYSSGLGDAGLYDLKAIPTLYLLDRDKNVILKDCDITDIESWLLANFEN